MSIAVRPYHPSDLYSLYQICLKTADSGQDGSHLYRDPELIGAIFAAPYAVAEPEKILERVASCAWISRPMTVSHSMACSPMAMLKPRPTARAGASRSVVGSGAPR